MRILYIRCAALSSRKNVEARTWLRRLPKRRQSPRPADEQHQVMVESAVVPVTRRSATMSDLMQATITRYRQRLATKAVVQSRGAIEASYPVLRNLLGERLWLVAVDDNTWHAAGKRLAVTLDAAGARWERYDVPPPPGGHEPLCDDDAIALFAEQLGSSGAAAAIAVGSGTINDIVKYACSGLGLPMACVATAPSMNGYTSGIAAILQHGVKTTQPCEPARAVVADLDVLSDAPMRMIQSGLGDLMSKPVSNSDWIISAKLTGSHHSAEAMQIIEDGSRLLDGVAPRLLQRDRDAIDRLSASLMLSGFAMSIAGSSSPASGGEHLVSHYLDMTAHAHGLPHDFHGCQVGVGTIAAAFVYEKLLAFDVQSFDIEARVAELAPWADYLQLLRERFGVLFDAVVPHARAAYPEPDDLRVRLEALRAQWSEIKAEVSRTLRTHESIREELAQAGCPVRFVDLRVEDRKRAFASIAWAKDIRSRYTVLHLAWELGRIDTWAGEALEVL
ncbi:MAG: iron-containing alcohol dehydrogenase [Spirochaetaceae bacterium]|nr:MAG: iron-containing alcohol dehydrogenase [Spirochaetaceae bacterium]